MEWWADSVSTITSFIFTFIFTIIHISCRLQKIPAQASP